jgi:hypothetical protein
MSGRLVWEWPATVMSYSVYLHDVLKLFPLQGTLQHGEEEEVAGGANLVSKAGGEPWGCCAWPRIP